MNRSIGEDGSAGEGAGRRGPRLAAGILLAFLTILAGATAAAGAGSADPFAGSDEVSLDASAVADKALPAAAEGLSNRLAALSSPRLDDAGGQVQADAISLPAAGPASLIRDGEKLIVQARIEGTSGAVLDSLRSAGAEIIFVSHRYDTVDLAAAEEHLREIAGLAAVSSVVELLEPETNGAGTGPSADDPIADIPAPCGSIISEADAQLRAAEARSAFEVDGTGIKVGILSDSYDLAADVTTRAANDIGTGDLPGPGNPCGRTTPVQVLADGATTDLDEGRAMAQIVHDVAPGAALAFAEAGNSEEAFAANVRALSDAGSQVIVDDITFIAEPFFQDGAISVAVNDVTAAGRPFFSSAANSNVIVDGQNVGSFEAPSFRLANQCITGTGVGCMDFDPGPPVDPTFCFVMQPGQFRANLQWAEPRFGVTTDLDFFLLDVATSSLISSSAQDNLTTQLPFEVMTVDNPTSSPRTFCVIVNKFSGAANPRLKFILSRATQISAAEFPTGTGGDVIGPSIFGHNGAGTAVSTAAVPFDDSATLETYSSFGPITLTHGPVNGTTPAAPLAAPLVVSKPDITATDRNRTTFFQPVGDGIFRFGGTSAAAPHAAGVAALQLDRNPAATVDQIEQAQFSTAVPVGAFPPEGRGAGLLDAVGAVGAIPGASPDCLKAKGKLAKAKEKLKRLKKKNRVSRSKLKKAKKKVKKAKGKVKKAC